VTELDDNVDLGQTPDVTGAFIGTVIGPEGGQ
jgi:hypothetical protein